MTQVHEAECTVLGSRSLYPPFRCHFKAGGREDQNQQEENGVLCVSREKTAMHRSNARA